MTQAWRGSRRSGASRLRIALVSIALAAAGVPAVSAGPLTDITRREAPPPPGSEPERNDDADTPTTELPSVIVKSRRQQEEETVRQKLEKAIKPKEDKPLEKDLNKADEAMKTNAAWSGDPDAYRNHPGDPTTKFLPPPGDETGGCGADITKGCKPRP